MDKPRHSPIPDGPAPEPYLGEPKGIKYTHFGEQNVRLHLAERLQRIEAEHYSHTVNLKIFAAHTDGPKAAEANSEIDNAKRALVVLEQAHAVVTSELAALGD